ncbi:hypothetical protein [Jannaschia formosa]|uniref:hypothetical protein n=1 Tax=Jannaschia formosa TaxID=2259592 RepID=UPI000E1C1F7D|nr:hypothetical protein [Jannaschia formosa]TFL17841.1 hypothetical protein DR046_13170 [Jannaschia formosa]
MITIVALLTTIGCSRNDDVVVRDRIREHLRDGDDAPLADFIGGGLNQVLARGTYTSGTTMAALMPRAIRGGLAVAANAGSLVGLAGVAAV